MSRGARAAGARGAETRARILAAARDLVARHGYAGTSIAMICREAGINASSLYWFFTGKEELFLTVVEEGADAFLDAVAPPRNGGGDPVAAVSRRLEENALFLRVLLVMMLEPRDLSPAFRGRMAEIRMRSLAWWHALLEGMLAPLGEPRAGALADELAIVCRAAINGAFIAEQFGEPVSVEAVLGRLLSLIESHVRQVAAELGGRSAADA